MPMPFSETMRALDAERPRLPLAVWGGSLALLALWIAWFVAGEVTVWAVSTTARLEAGSAPHAIDAPFAGRLILVQARIGDHVRAGDLLFEIDSSDLNLRIAEERARQDAARVRASHLAGEIAAREAAQAASAEADQARRGIAVARSGEAQAALAEAEADRARAQRLLAKGSMPAAEAERAEMAHRRLASTAEAQRLEIDAASAAAEASRLTESAAIEERRRELAELEGAAAVADAAIAVLQGEIEQRRIRAPADGRLGEIAALAPGAYVAEGQRLGTVVRDAPLIVVAEFAPDAAIGRIGVDHQALIRLAGFPWTRHGVLRASVTRVAGEVREGAVRVELALTGPSGMPLQHGLAGEVEIAVARASPADLALQTLGLRGLDGGRL